MWTRRGIRLFALPSIFSHWLNSATRPALQRIADPLFLRAPIRPPVNPLSDPEPPPPNPFAPIRYLRTLITKNLI